jgi:peptide/nickel transport system permease protein
MLKIIGRRILISIPMIFIVSFLVFALIDLAPGDPARSIAGDNQTPERLAEIREALRLDDPLPVRYGRWVGNLLQGDLGESYIRSGASVVGLIKEKFSVTLSELVVALTFMTIMGIGLGTLAALRPGGALDRVVTVGASFSIAMPPMWLAALLISTFAVQRNWLPSQGYVPVSQGWWKWLQHLLLPGFTMAFVPAAEIALQLKSGLVDSLRRDYITASRAKGMRGVTIVFKHAMKNAAIPVVTVLGLRIGVIIGSSAIVDSIFLMNGLGSLVLEATRNKDIPILLGFIILTTVVTILINVLVDISYGYFNPKVRT